MKAKILVAALIASGLSITANAADTGTLTVNANVQGICKFQAPKSATATLANSAGNIDPSLATSATGAGTINYMCTKGQAPVFVNNLGLNSPGAGLLAVKHATLADTMQYTLALTDTGSGTGFGAGVQTLTLTGTIIQSQFQAAAAGAYSDTVTITLTP